jgi:hypothetical protein
MSAEPPALEWPVILEAVGGAQTGERPAGREGLLACWARTAPADHAYRCVLAHYLADVQDSLADEVAWDTTALEEFAHLGGADLAAVGILDGAGSRTPPPSCGSGWRRRGRWTTTATAG